MSKKEGNLTVPIFFAIDDKYIPFLAVTLQSLIYNSSEENIYEIKILYAKNVSKENITKIKKCEKENIKIEFVDLNSKLEQIKNKLHTRNYFSSATYFRLFIPELYPQYDKAIYLDSDTIVLTDVAELYNINLKKNLLGAVSDGAVQAIEVFQEYVEKVVGVSDHNNYFNAGVLLMNLKELREHKLQEKFIYLLERLKYEVAQDQDYFNRICKGRVKILDDKWNTMPIMGEKKNKDDLKIIHYNLGTKPWHFDGVMYEDYFWKYAKMTEYYKVINDIKKNYKEADKVRDDANSSRLIELAKYEADCVGDDKKGQLTLRSQMNIMKRFKEQIVEKSKDRLEILEKIKKLEEEGKFDMDAEDDPPTIPLEKEKVDYLNQKSTSKVKTLVANQIGKSFIRKLLRDNKMIIKEINGVDYLDEVKGGAMLTCNHFNPYDSMAIETMFRTSGQIKKRKLYKVIREGNYTNFPGLYGFFFKNCNTLPLSSKTSTMVNFVKAVEEILKRGDFILIYPEQSLWWNYKKPKPLKDGAYKLASKSLVPVIPIFITMEDSEIIGDDGFPIQQYIINIEAPIYPDEKLSIKENTEMMKNKNFEVWKNIYEKFYGEKLKYTTVNKEKMFND